MKQDNNNIIRSNRVIRVNMTDLSIKEELLPEEDRALGGRTLTSRVIAREVEPTCYPLGAKNKLVFAAGVFAGTPVSSSNRISIGAKSPLTGGIKESNGGGITALKMARLGVRAIIIEGQPGELSQEQAGERNRLPLYVLAIAKDGARLVAAEDLRGMGNYRLVASLQEKFGDNLAIASIGPTGERRQSAAGIANLDREGRPARFCGRGGLGAVMGSKGLKAVILDDKGCSPPQSVDRPKFQALFKEYNQLLLNSENIAVYTKYGTAAMLENTNAMGILPTRNFSTGYYDQGEKLGGEALHDLISRRGGAGETTHACMPGCVIRCSNVFPDKDGQEVVSPLEYETIGLLGSNCDISDLDVIARLNYLCNDYGLDTIETGAAVAIAMDAGLIPFGDQEEALRLVEEMGQGTILGRVLAEGAEVTGRVLGVRRIPVVKGQAMPAYEPRGIKGLAITYATSPMGADHTAGNTIRAQIDHRSPAGQEEISRRAQWVATLLDSLGLCIFIGSALGTRLELLAELVTAHTGVAYTQDELLDLGRETVALERHFNKKAGFTSAHDRLPEHFICEISPSAQTLFDVTEEQLAGVHPE